MAKIESTFFDIGYLDTLSYQQSPIHRLDPRAKLIVTLVFVVAVVSFDRYEISGLLGFFLFPVVMVSLGDLPLGYLLKKLLLVAPFAVFIGIFNPILDRQVMIVMGPLAISGGWVSFISILLRFGLTVTAALILIATSSFAGVCLALERLKVPRSFAVQLLFLYRYLFVLIAETRRLLRARTLRSFDGRGLGIKVVGSLIGHLLLRTLNRGRRIYLAMLCRGFDGEIHTMRRLKMTGWDFIFMFGWILFFIVIRNHNLPQLIGNLLTGVF
ncbi:MAG: cobalt ECF transporter T component CbiQ [Proteobacteria bacterium]|nr:cobalt ECF transporter T component CbiQ [Pseudomonadota bacterium]MBU1715332.1 cobalt ECF transporter T component CbiQ [Pseudomonadota bacterium]